MGCAVGCLALFFPRLALALVWLLGPVGYLGAPFPSRVWPILGFVFLPTTTLAFVFASGSMGASGEVTPFGWLLTGLALLVDLGLLGGGRHASRRRAPERQDERNEG